MLAQEEETPTLTRRVDQGGVLLQPVAARLSQAELQTHMPPNHEHQPGMLRHVHPILTRIAVHQHGMHRLGHQIRMRMVGVLQRGTLARGHPTHMRRVRMRARSALVRDLHGVVQLLEGMRAGGRRLGGRRRQLGVIGIVARGSLLRIRVLGETPPMRMVGGVVQVQLQLQAGMPEEVG
jgi:hypothetical protein